jgi:hypothetical protein
LRSWRQRVWLIAKATPISQYASYGLLSIKETLWWVLLRQTLAGGDASFVALAAFLSILVGGALFALRAWQSPQSIPSALLPSHSADRFFLFGAIYVLSFVIGSNWDYRLIFLIPTLPFAFELLRTQNHFRFGLSYILCVLPAENCIAFYGGYKTFLAEAFTTAVFLLQLTILAQIAKSHLSGESRLPASADSDFVKLESPVA